jgi:tetratricopeptide (TPR) repeat protein
MKRIRLIPCCLGLLLLAASSLSAQQAGVIVGELHVIRGDFPGRTLVELQLRGAPIASQYSDEQGRFAFYSLQSNLYHVVVSDERFYPVDYSAKLDLSVISTLIVQINLTPREVVKKDDLPGQEGGNPHIVDLEQYKRHFPKPALKEFDKGVASDRKGNRDEAIKHYEKALSLAPDFYPAHNNLGSDYLTKSDFSSAQSHFEEAIKLNQSDGEAHLNLANVFLMTKNYQEAMKNVEEGLRRNPISAFGQFLLGSIYERLGKLGDAEHALREALKLDPKMSKVHLELVNLYLSQQKKLEASAELRSFLKDSPNDPFAPKAKEVLTRLESSR